MNPLLFDPQGSRIRVHNEPDRHRRRTLPGGVPTVPTRSPNAGESETNHTLYVSVVRAGNGPSFVPVIHEGLAKAGLRQWLR